MTDRNLGVTTFAQKLRVGCAINFIPYRVLIIVLDKYFNGDRDIVYEILQRVNVAFYFIFKILNDFIKDGTLVAVYDKRVNDFNDDV